MILDSRCSFECLHEATSSFLLSVASPGLQVVCKATFRHAYGLRSTRKRLFDMLTRLRSTRKRLFDMLTRLRSRLMLYTGDLSLCLLVWQDHYARVMVIELAGLFDRTGTRLQH